MRVSHASEGFSKRDTRRKPKEIWGYRRVSGVLIQDPIM